MTDNLYDALEICLQALEKGADVESCLKLFPALEDDLRPILETATAARAQAIESVPADAMRRGRARVLQHAAELRESQRVAPIPFWRKLWQQGWGIRTLATSLTMVIFLFSGGTGLVFASSGSIPGDNLYPVKRSWEGVQLALIVDPKAKVEREKEFERERVDEIHELFSESRQTQVDFQGKVDKQGVNVWQIAGLKIAIDDDATFTGDIFPGSLVRVVGETEDGIIQAEHITLIQPGPATQTPTATNTQPPAAASTLPPTEHPTELETQAPEETVEPGETEKPEKLEIETSKPEQTEAPEKEPTKEPADDGGGDNGGSDDGED